MSTGSINYLVSTSAQLLGASEPAFRLVLTILAGYPLAGIYRTWIRTKNANTQHIFFAVSGFLLCYFNYGLDVFHSFISILLTYIWVKIAFNSRYLVSVSFIFHMAYLLTGYYITESENYDIKWTMPQCVLTLRLIGYVYDISDGKVPPEKQSKDQKENCLTQVPSLLELFGFSYFPASFIVGPQYPFRRYKKFVAGEFNQYKSAINCGLKRGCVGIIYLAMRQIGSAYIPDSYLLTQEFKNLVFIKKLAIMAIWGKLTLYKYVACWLLTEGALTCFGITFSKVTEDGQEDWSECLNVRLIKMELANQLGDFVHSFNVNTNTWVSIYVFKRLKFLGNRMVSHALALLFLAIWHGFHSGYYVSFFFEFAFITFERQLKEIYGNFSIKHSEITNTIYCNVFIFVITRVYTLIIMGWCLMPFVFFTFRRWTEIIVTIHYYGAVFLAPWYLGRFIYFKFYRKNRGSHDANVSVTDKEKTQ